MVMAWGFAPVPRPRPSGLEKCKSKGGEINIHVRNIHLRNMMLGISGLIIGLM